MCALSNVLFLLVAMSKNSKTGGISQIYASNNTCPFNACPFKNKGCYAKVHHTFMAWKKCNLTIEQLKQKASQIPLTNIIRYGVAGDLCKENTNDINKELVYELMNIFNNKTLYGYTHCNIYNPDNIEIIKLANSKNFKINVSCESFEKVQFCINNNLPCIMAVQKMDANIKRINNMLFVKCPNQVIEEKNKELKKQGKELLPIVNCSNCKACINTNRCKNTVIVFQNHGALKKRNDFLINL